MSRTRRNHWKKVAALGAALLVLSACGAPRDGRGSRPGPRLYRGLTQAEAQTARAAVHEALETLRSNNARAWRASDGGSGGTVTPLRTYKSVSGAYCREYREIVTTARYGRASANRLACRDRDGVWKRARK